MTVAKTNYKRQHKNPGTPRICRDVPAALEMGAIGTALAVKDASGKYVYPVETVVKTSYRGKQPTLTIGSRYPRQHMKWSTFKVHTEQFDFQPYASV